MYACIRTKVILYELLVSESSYCLRYLAYLFYVLEGPLPTFYPTPNQYNPLHPIEPFFICDQF
jgi:hypothetical protein